MRGAISKSLLILPLLGLAACAGGPFGGVDTYVLTKTQVRPSYDVANFRFAHGGGEMPIVVTGESPGAGGAAIGEAVAAAMTGHTPAGPTTFAYRPETSADASRLAVRVAPPITLSANALCAGSDPESAAGTDQRLTLLIAYCNRDRHLSSTRLSVPRGTAGPDATALDRGAAVTALKLFPARDPNDDPRTEFDFGG